MFRRRKRCQVKTTTVTIFLLIFFFPSAYKKNTIWKRRQRKWRSKSQAIFYSIFSIFTLPNFTISSIYPALPAPNIVNFFLTTHTNVLNGANTVLSRTGMPLWSSRGRMEWEALFYRTCCFLLWCPIFLWS